METLPTFLKSLGAKFIPRLKKQKQKRYRSQNKVLHFTLFGDTVNRAHSAQSSSEPNTSVLHCHTLITISATQWAINAERSITPLLISSWKWLVEPASLPAWMWLKLQLLILWTVFIQRYSQLPSRLAARYVVCDSEWLTVSLGAFFNIYIYIHWSGVRTVLFGCYMARIFYVLLW